MVVDKKSNFS
jgi:hypothetical protein